MNFIISENVQEVVFISFISGEADIISFFLLYLLLVSSTRFVQNKFISTNTILLTDSRWKLEIRKFNRQFSSGNGDHEF